MKRTRTRDSVKLTLVFRRPAGSARSHLLGRILTGPTHVGVAVGRLLVDWTWKGRWHYDLEEYVRAADDIWGIAQIPVGRSLRQKIGRTDGWNCVDFAVKVMKQAHWRPGRPILTPNGLWKAVQETPNAKTYRPEGGRERPGPGEVVGRLQAGRTANRPRGR